MDRRVDGYVCGRKCLIQSANGWILNRSVNGYVCGWIYGLMGTCGGPKTGSIATVFERRLAFYYLTPVWD